MSQPAGTEGQRDRGTVTDGRCQQQYSGGLSTVAKQSSSDTSTSSSSLSCWYRQGGCCGDFYTTLWPHHLRLIRPGNICPSSVVHFCWVRVNYSLSFLFLPLSVVFHKPWRWLRHPDAEWPYFPTLMHFEVHQRILIMHCCHAIGWLDWWEDEAVYLVKWPWV